MFLQSTPKTLQFEIANELGVHDRRLGPVKKFKVTWSIGFFPATQHRTRSLYW